MHSTLLHMISLDILISFLLKRELPLLDFHKYLLSTHHFLVLRLGFFSLTWNLAFSLPASLPSSLDFSPHPPWPHWCPHGQAAFPACTGPQRSLTGEHLSLPSLTWHLVIKAHVTCIKLIKCCLPRL